MKIISTKGKSPLTKISSRAMFALPAIGLLLVWSCTQAPASPTPAVQPPATPRYEESSRPPVQRQALPTPASTTQSPLTEAEKASILAFAQTIKKVDKEWEVLQEEYDSWRRSESTCNREIMRQDLEQFLGDLSSIMRNLENLDRASQTRIIAESLVKAGEREQKALRTLRDAWEPGDKGVFEAFEAEKAQSNLARRQASDDLKDLITKASRPTPTPGARQTPTPSLTPTPGAQQTPTPSITPTPGAQQTPTPSITPTPGAQQTPTPSITPTPGAQQTPTPSGEPLDAKVLSGFSQSVTELNSKWDNFHTAYDQWRQKGGKCDRQGINLKLVGFASRLSEIKKSISLTGQTSSVRPLKGLLLEAAQREEDALRTLRQTWEPYEPSQFNQFESMREEVNKLRRQAMTGLEDLLAQ